MPVIRLNWASDEFPVARYAKTFYGLFQNRGGLPPYIKIAAPLVTSIMSMFRGSNGANTVDVSVGNLSGNVVSYAFYSVSIQSVRLRNSIAACTDLKYMFGNSTLTGIYGEPLDLSAATDVLNLFGAGLQHVTIAVSSIRLNIAFPSNALTAASLFSIANGLAALAAPKTLTLTAAAKANMDVLMADDAGGTAVEGTAMTLTAFITTIKGWSVATV